MNILYIVVTLEVSKFDISAEVNDEQFWNKESISITEEVFIFPKLIFSNFEQSENIDCML